MGAGSSVPLDSDGASRPMKLKLDDIPESCAAMILSYLDPPEICQLALLSRPFQSASSADFIWESKLPTNYRFIVEKYLGEGFLNLGKKDIYARLSRAVSFDDGTKEVWLDKRTGGVCLSISAKALKITGIDDRRHWNHIPTNESRFQTIAYLQQIWWLEVDGEFEFQYPKGTYSLFFRLQLGRVTKRLGRRVCNSGNIHGWDIKPVQFHLTTPDGKHALSQYFLDNLGNWAYFHVGDFVVQDPNASTKIKFSLTQIDCTHPKAGLCVDSVLICPSNLAKQYRSIS